VDWKLELVVVPVTDVDRAKRFYAEQLGFNVDVDHSPNDQFRVVQLTPPGSTCSISIGKGLSDAVPGTLKGIQISVGDIETAHRQLVEHGVECTPIRHFGAAGWEEGKGEDWNSFVSFDDPDGNGWVIQESPVLRAAMAEG
jgi:catechol 2,3-dioxygenase-like lactoylglutathione lyase family enzyme